MAASQNFPSQLAGAMVPLHCCSLPLPRLSAPITGLPPLPAPSGQLGCCGKRPEQGPGTLKGPPDSRFPPALLLALHGGERPRLLRDFLHAGGSFR